MSALSEKLNMQSLQYDVFISYRRDCNFAAAKLVFDPPQSVQKRLSRFF